ncbi:MAG: polysaccharide deacetylase family protein [Phycisphaerales bacterium]|nr:polysaccharide deacetylase family protein [Phycisphaerales bacterium]
MADAKSTWIINFHGIGEIERAFDPGESEVWLDIDRFRSILDSIEGKPDLQITFDDGNQSDLEIAVPELLKRDLRAVFFIPAGKIGEETFLTCEGLKEMVSAGMQIGSHGWSHRAWRSLDPSIRRQEFEESKNRLEQIIQRPVDLAACPFGDYNRSVFRHLRSAGYRAAYTSDRGIAIEGQFAKPRNTVHANDDGESLLSERHTFEDSLQRRLRLAVKRWR